MGERERAIPAILRDIGAMVWTTVIEGLSEAGGAFAALLQLAARIRQKPGLTRPIDLMGGGNWQWLSGQYQ